MNRLTILLLASASGIAIAGGAALAAGDATTTRQPMATSAMPASSPTLARQDPSPAIGERIGLGRGTSGIATAVVPSSVAVATTAPDPAGGAPWALRTFQRRGLSGTGLVWCAQLGRIVDHRFVWITPGAERVGPIRAGDGETTVCATASPIAQRLGVMTASMPDRPVRDLAARIGATVTWGVVDRPVAAARVAQGGTTAPVQLMRHGFMRVLPGSAPSTLPRLIVTDIGGGTRLAIPPMYFVSNELLRPMDGKPRKLLPGDLARPHAAPKGLGRLVQPSELRQFATFSQPSNDLPQGLFEPIDAGPTRCYVQPIGAVSGEPVIADRYTGLVRQPPLFCQPFPPASTDKPVSLGSGWESEDLVSRGTPAAKLAYERRVWERVPPGSGSMLVAVPPGTAMLEVQSPVGVKTVKVGPARITRIGWAGQPEVQRALFPMAVRRKNGQYVMRFRGSVVFRALDAQGKQVGRAMTIGSAAQTRR